MGGYKFYHKYPDIEISKKTLNNFYGTLFDINKKLFRACIQYTVSVQAEMYDGQVYDYYPQQIGYIKYY